MGKALKYLTVEEFVKNWEINSQRKVIKHIFNDGGIEIHHISPLKSVSARLIDRYSKEEFKEAGVILIAAHFENPLDEEIYNLKSIGYREG